MREFLIVALSVFLFSCSQEKSIDGTFLTKQKCFVYGLKVNKAEREVRLFLLEELSTEITFEEYTNQQNWSEYRMGTLNSKGNNSWSLFGIDSDVVGSDRPEEIGISIENDTIKMNCKEIYDTFTGIILDMSDQFCSTDSIVFFKVE